MVFYSSNIRIWSMMVTFLCIIWNLVCIQVWICSKATNLFYCLKSSKFVHFDSVFPIKQLLNSNYENLIHNHHSVMYQFFSSVKYMLIIWECVKTHASNIFIILVISMSCWLDLNSSPTFPREILCHEDTPWPTDSTWYFLKIFGKQTYWNLLRITIQMNSDMFKIVNKG